MENKDKQEIFYLNNIDGYIYLDANAAKQINRDASVKYIPCYGYEENTDIIFKPIHEIDKLYHYCSIPTMMNIIRNNCLWLTNCQTSNDSEEMLWAIKKLKELAKSSLNENNLNSIGNKEIVISILENEIQRVKDIVDSDTLAELQRKKSEMIDMSDEKRINTYRNNVLEIYEGVLKDIQDNMSQVYVSCFSEAKDSLSQWRGYGDDGYGIAIGFNANKLNSLTQYNIKLQQVLYFDAHQNKILTNGLSKYALRLIDSKDWFYYNILPVMKPQGFSEEQEFRLVVIPRNSTMEAGYYFRGGKLLDYYKLPLHEDYISEIVLGPKCKIEKKDLITFFKSCGMTIREDQIIHSTLSYK